MTYSMLSTWIRVIRIRFLLASVIAVSTGLAISWWHFSQIDISVGELLDKITILEIKSERISDPDKLININKELNVLNRIWNDSSYSGSAIDKERQELKKINDKSSKKKGKDIKLD